jgi:cob(I)alamin adenosyltransferase
MSAFMSAARRAATPTSLVLLNTGDGKGKSTAAFGVVVRALARNWRVGVIQFLKSAEWPTGEERLLRALGVEWIKGGDGFTWKTGGTETSRALARATWESAVAALREGHYQLLLLDEITLPIAFGWLTDSEVVEAIRSRAAGVNVILTGRLAPPSLIELADTVTEMRSVHHAFDKGVLARAGIDY